MREHLQHNFTKKKLSSNLNYTIVTERVLLCYCFTTTIRKSLIRNITSERMKVAIKIIEQWCKDHYLCHRGIICVSKLIWKSHLKNRVRKSYIAYENAFETRGTPMVSLLKLSHRPI